MHPKYRIANSASPANNSNEDDLYSQQSCPRTSCGLYNESGSKNSQKEANKKIIQCCCLWWLRYINATPDPFITYLNSKFLNMLLAIRMLLLFTLVAGNALPPVIRIGAIFTEQERNSNVELAFKYAIYGINKDKLILPNTQLVYSIEYVSRDDSFHTAKKVCGQLESGVQAIFGPSDSLLSGHIQSICDALNIPHIETRIELEASVTQFSINLYPSQRNINLAYRDLMIYLNWTNVAIIYEEDYGLFRQQDLVNTNFSSRWEMYIRQATPATYRQVLRSIRHKEIYKLIIDTNPSNIKSFFRAQIMSQNSLNYIVDAINDDIASSQTIYVMHPSPSTTTTSLDSATSSAIQSLISDAYQKAVEKVEEKNKLILLRLTENVEGMRKEIIDLKKAVSQNNATIIPSKPFANIEDFLNFEKTILEDIDKFSLLILQLQMNDYRYHYMFTTFDIDTFDLEDFKYNSVNITAFRLVDVESKPYIKIMEQMQKFQHSGADLINGSPYIQTNPALMLDSVYAFVAALMDLHRPHTLTWRNISCNDEIPWSGGLSLYNYINAVTIYGLTGKVHFQEGRRNMFKLDLLKLKHGRIQKVGSWSSNEGLNITDPTAFFDVSVANITLVVMTRKEKPYVMVKEESNLTGNARYEGFCIDLLRAIAAQAGFHYKIELVPDNMYGVYNSETTSWNGIVRELMERRADLAVASMTINYERESVIDFTKPFMNLGIGILFKVPSGQPTRLFSFMNPLAIEIWLYVLAAYLLVSFILFVMARFSPYEWNYPCHKEFDIVENQFSVSNSFWFITGTFLRQGSGLNPKATSTRIVGGIWWFFTLIVISSYTANLAAFLTVERMTTPMENAADLVEQTEISYGTLEGGSTMTFFRDSKIGVYQKMWHYMENRKPSVFVKTYEEGIKRALEGNYAFLMESTMLDFAVQRDCNLMQIGGLLDSKGYGIATPKGSHWRDVLSLAILELQGNGITQILYDKWWKNTGDVCNRDNKRKESKANALGVENIGGVFVVLLCGLALAVVVAILEFCWNSKKNSHLERQPLCTEMAKELGFAMHFHTAKQRPALKQDCVKCSASCSTYFPMEARMPHVSGVHSNFLN